MEVAQKCVQQWALLLALLNLFITQPKYHLTQLVYQILACRIPAWNNLGQLYIQ
jgi:hypothetical protein